jgi:hypothetical protein
VHLFDPFNFALGSEGCQDGVPSNEEEIYDMSSDEPASILRWLIIHQQPI